MSVVTSSRASFTDLLKFIAFTIILWSSSLTFLLPIVILLSRFSQLRTKFFALTWNRSGKAGNRLHPLRQILFKILRNNVADFEDKPLKVLELTTGLSGNIRFYSENHKVTIICRNKELQKSLKTNVKNFENITLLECGLENLSNLTDNSFDLVISTLYLCSVSDVDGVVNGIKRVLKQGGKFAFLEHVGFPEDRMEFLLQKLATKFWKIFADGCHLDRHLTENLKRARFSTIAYTTYYPQAQVLYMRPTVIGLCKK